MNTPNPFDSQTTPNDPIHQSRTKLRLAIFAAFGLSLLVLVPLLVQGCKRQEESLAPEGMSLGLEDTNLPPDLTSSNLDLPPLAPLPGTVPPPPAPSMGVVPTSAAPLMQEYIVVKGDSFYVIAKKFGVTVKMMQDANPGVDSSRLQIGQKLNVPPAVVHESVAGATAAAVTDGSTIYTVKSGDTLLRIAKQFGTTYKAIMAANSLTTEKIKVGQKLKIPAKETTATLPPIAEPSPVPMLPPPVTTVPPPPSPMQ